MRCAILLLATVISGPAFAATILPDEPPSGWLQSGQRVAYKSKPCSASNAAKPYKVVT